MAKEQNLVASFWERRSLRTIGGIARSLRTEADGSWSAKIGGATASVKDTNAPNGTLISREIHLKRVTVGTVATGDIVVEFGEFDQSPPSVDVKLYNGGDFATGDKPTTYSTTNRGQNEVVLGLPSGLGKTISALRFVTQMQANQAQAPLGDGYSAAERQMLDEK